MAKTAHQTTKNPWGLNKTTSTASPADQLSDHDKKQIEVARQQQKQQLLVQLHQARITYYGLDRQRNKALHSLNRLQRQFDNLEQAEANDYYTTT